MNAFMGCQVGTKASTWNFTTKYSVNYCQVSVALGGKVKLHVKLAVWKLKVAENQHMQNFTERVSKVRLAFTDLSIYDYFVIVIKYFKKKEPDVL